MFGRRTMLAAAVGLSAPSLPRVGGAQTAPGGGPDAFPSRPIAVLSGYAPGGVTDITSRAVSERFARDLG